MHPDAAALEHGAHNVEVVPWHAGYNLACINMYVPPKVRDGTVVPLEAGTTSSMQARGPWNKEVVMDVDCREMEMDLQEDEEGESACGGWEFS